MTRTNYLTDLSDAEWNCVAALFPVASLHGRPRLHSQREIVNAILYLVRSGCAWRLLPHDLPPWKTVYHYFRLWRLDGTWERLHTTIRERVRRHLGRDAQPSAEIIDTDVYKLSRAEKSSHFFLSIRLESFKPRMLTCVKTCEAQRNSP